MGRRARELSAIEVRRLVEPGFYFVGTVSGLALSVTSKDARSWTLRYMVDGRRRDLGLGPYPEVTLEQARNKAREAREGIRLGTDPIDARKARVRATAAERAGLITFDECVTAYLAAHSSAWRNAKHADQWQTTLDTYASPKIGKLSIRDVALPHVLSILEPIWHTKTETASRLRGRIESVLDWATAREYRSGENPARWRGHLDKLLPKPSRIAKIEHHAAVPYTEMAAFMVRLRAQPGLGARGVEFTILTAARSGEVRGAKWSEIDKDAAVWTVPAERMKAGKEHRVPLSKEALAVIESLPQLDTELVFPTRNSKPLSDMAFTAVLRRMKVKATVHGFRSSFRDWAAEQTDFPRDVAEMALAHTVGDKVEAAYRRGDLFQKRQKMMQTWAGYAIMHNKFMVIDEESVETGLQLHRVGCREECRERDLDQG